MLQLANLTVVQSPEASPERDLQNRADVVELVQAFYRRAFGDPLLGHIFVDVARMDLDRHLPVMADFWETVLFQAGLYRRNALQVHFEVHAKEALGAEHFGRWLELWTSTVDGMYRGEKAELAKLQAGRIAGSIHRRVQGKSPSEFVSISRQRPTSS